MHLSIFVSLLVAVSAAPHVHNAHQNRLVRRRAGPLLHEDLIALYNAGQVAATSTESATDASETEASGHGPYAAGEAHGGNPLAAKVLVEVSATTSAAVATETGDSSIDWVPAAASRNTTIYAHSYSSEASDDSTDKTNDNVNTISAASLASLAGIKSSTGLPGWAIAVTVIMILLSLGGLAGLIYLKFRKASSSDSSEKSQKSSKKEPEDALSSYKAFWETKRRSAGSFISADASPEALATERALSRPVSHSSNITLPLYEESDIQGLGIGLAVSSPANTPLNEEAPPRGFLYQ